MTQSWRYAVTGNIKKTRVDENGVLRYGTAAFKGNAKAERADAVAFLKRIKEAYGIE